MQTDDVNLKFQNSLWRFLSYSPFSTRLNIHIALFRIQRGRKGALYICNTNNKHRSKMEIWWRYFSLYSCFINGKKNTIENIKITLHQCQYCSSLYIFWVYWWQSIFGVSDSRFSWNAPYFSLTQHGFPFWPMVYFEWVHNPNFTPRK